MLLHVRDLLVSVEGKPILQGFSLEVPASKTVALMGPNGSGKSTLTNVLAGHPSYQVDSGEIQFNGQNLLAMNPEERAQAGLFLAFQYPPSLAGVSVSHFLRLALNAQEKARGAEATSLAAFIRSLRLHLKTLEIPAAFAERSLGEGFSGGEKKRLEMLQALVLQPKLVVLDEIDSGLDIDAIKLVAAAARNLTQSTFLVITHYQRLLNYLPADAIHIVKDGRIVQSGGPELALELEATGYHAH